MRTAALSFESTLSSRPRPLYTRPLYALSFIVFAPPTHTPSVPPTSPFVSFLSSFCPSTPLARPPPCPVAMGLGQKLNWSQTTRDGAPRSTLAKIIDPVGVCIEPAALDPFVAPEVPLPESDVSDDADQTASAGAPAAHSGMDHADDTYQQHQH